jgi:stage II sporulation protein AB (anti-sigma F factor)
MKAYNTVTITFPSRSANEGFARSAAVCFAAQLDPTLEEVNDLKTAVSEAVTNAIVHGYPDTIGTITMKLRLYENQVVEIQVKDKGVGIRDIEEAKTPLFTTGGKDRSGMGFTIMETFTDDLRVRSALGKGTTVTLRKKLSGRIRSRG